MPPAGPPPHADPAGVSGLTYLRQGQAQRERPHQQQMGLDPHHGPVGAAHRVDRLVCIQILLGLDPEATHGVDHCLLAAEHTDQVNLFPQS